MLAEAAFLPPLLAVKFRVAGVPRTQAWLRKRAEVHGRTCVRSAPQLVLRDALFTQRAVKRATGIGGSCLVRSLSLWAILLRRGIHADLRIGVRRSGEAIQGHAWLEIEGIPVNEKGSVVRTYSVYDGPVSFDRMTKT